MKKNRTNGLLIKAVFIILMPAFVLLSGCEPSGKADDTTTVVCTVFPIYDWTREITKDCEDINVILLEDDGTDMHSFQPAVKDLVDIEDCDVFIYIGGESEEWAKEYSEKHPSSKRTDICLMDEISGDILIENDEGIIVTEEEEEEAYDEHIWLSLKRSIKCVDVIGGTLKDKTSDSSKIESNLTSYEEKLSSLDKEYEEYFSANPRTLIIADRFPFRYLAEDYGFGYMAAFPGCSAESSISFVPVVELSEGLKNNDGNVVFITESGDMSLAETVIEQSGKDAIVVIIDSLQCVSLKKIEEGATYYSLMKSNLDALKQE
ncbi:MAG: zinc ABC transporter substrate-binding protein [Lachnospiraceae bacterium]|nr:zinc ABC transporter substrate-binding protein [Lachnospiraceae bacterium]